MMDLNRRARKFYRSRSMGLSAFRVVVAMIVVRNGFTYLPLADELFGAHGISPYYVYAASINHTWLDWAMYPFYLPGAPEAFIVVMIVLGVLFMLGIGKRITGVVLLLMLTLLRLRNPFILDGSDNVIQVTLLFLILAYSYAHFSYDLPKPRGYRDLKGRLAKLSLVQAVLAFATLAVMVQICYVYFFTAAAKFQGELWLNGTAVYYTMRVHEFRATPWNIPLTANHYFVVAATYGTLIFEVSFAFLVWFRKTKWLVLAAGVTLHVGIWVFMRIDNFSWVMIGAYPVFITNEEYRHAFRLLQRSWTRLIRRLPFVTTTTAPALQDR